MKDQMQIYFIITHNYKIINYYDIEVRIRIKHFKTIKIYIRFVIIIIIIIIIRTYCVHFELINV